MAQGPKSTISAEILEYYKKLVAVIPDVEVKGAGMPYTAVNGNMFSFLDKEGRLQLRLRKSDLADIIDKLGAQQATQHGVVLKEYVTIPDRVFRDEVLSKDYLSRSYRYALSLKAKAAKKRSV